MGLLMIISCQASPAASVTCAKQESGVGNAKKCSTTQNSKQIFNDKYENKHTDLILKYFVSCPQ